MNTDIKLTKAILLGLINTLVTLTTCLLSKMNEGIPTAQRCSLVSKLKIELVEKKSFYNYT